ncbi:MAG: glycoside hydrolase, partial [Acidobacteriales bacterium]
MPRSEEGIPVGNGRMGSLVWTTPASMKFQINRADVYANNSYTNSFFERHADYCCGCGYVDIDFVQFGEDVFPNEGTRQHLSVYDALLNMTGRGVDAKVMAWHAQDVMAVEVTERREQPAPVSVGLKMLRYGPRPFSEAEASTRQNIVTVESKNHKVISQLHIRDAKILLTQDFREGNYCCKSAVAIGVAGRPSKAWIEGDSEVRLAAQPGKGTFTVLIASAATFDPKEDVGASALRQLDAAAAKGFGELAKDNQGWWHDFWSKGFVHLQSADGTAQYVEQNYTYYLYVMAACSRGKYPAKFNGMLWNTGGDQRAWGGQHWYANLSCCYEALPATNRFELMDPMYDMYSGMYDASVEAARQQWGSKGMFIAETSWFDGLAKLPDDIAAEMQDLYLLRKPWEQRSAKFMDYALTKHPHSSRWNWIAKGEWVNGRYVIVDRGAGPFGAVNHILGSNAKIAYLYWRRYEFTMDREWLKNRAYPMLKGATEFYRNFPNVKKGADGKYHIHHVNSNESVYGARDTDEDMSAMRGVTAAVIRASEILGVDADLRPAWKEFLANLAPLPTTDDPQALKPENYQGPRTFTRGLKPAVRGGGGGPDGNSLPMWFFDLCVLEARDKETLQTANNTFDASIRGGMGPKTSVSVLSKIAIAGTNIGRADAVRYLIPNQMKALRPERGTAYQSGGVLANRMTLREGPQALDAQRLGRASEALHLALLQSFAPEPAGDPILHVFGAWPKEWDAEYKLLARGGFLVTSSMRAGQLEFVELQSMAGEQCRLR